MYEVNLDDATIKHDNEWFTAEALTRKIEEKMQSGDMKFADLASALEELKKTMENSHTIEVKVAISKQDYEKLKAKGGEDDRAAVRKATLSFIESGGGAKPEKKKVIKCSKCRPPIEVSMDERPTEIKCPS